jgi:hypothetical protein
MDFPTKAYKALIWLTLYAATLHFFDNVYFFDQYPEPAWLSPAVVGALWIPLALLAHRAVDYLNAGKIERTYSLVHGFVSGNWLSLGHYLFASPAEVPLRINLIIGLQVGMATLLFGLALWLQLRKSPGSLRWTARAWAKNLTIYGVVIVTLEQFWPSSYSAWWQV